jgi:hypothetical protein
MKSLKNRKNHQVILKKVWRTGKINRFSYEKSGERGKSTGYSMKSLGNGENQ